MSSTLFKDLHQVHSLYIVERYGAGSGVKRKTGICLAAALF
jgi:hypothetical protein